MFSVTCKGPVPRQLKFGHWPQKPKAKFETNFCGDQESGWCNWYMDWAEGSTTQESWFDSVQELGIFHHLLTASRLCLDPSHCTVRCMTQDVSTEVNRPARGADLHVVRGQGVFVAMLLFRVCLPGVHSDNFIFTELWLAPAAVT